MATQNKLISAIAASKLIAEGKAVRAGTPEHKAMMAALWEQVARRFVFVVSLGKWVWREKGTDKGQVTDWAAQRAVDDEFRTPKLVLTYGRNDGKVRAVYESPDLKYAAAVFSGDEEPEGGHASVDANHIEVKTLIAHFMETAPNKPRVFETAEGFRVYNLWTEPTVRAIGSAKYHEPRWFLDVVDRFFGPEHTTERDYFLDWCAHLVCKPEVKMPVSVLLTSRLNGAGKNFMAEALKWMVGERNYKSITADILQSGFHSFAAGTTLAVVSELYEQGNYKFADKLKTWQSEDELFMNIKNGPMENSKNVMHFLAFSNRETPMNLDETDRRWFTFASPQKERADKAWWDDKWRFLKHPKTGLPHMGALGSLRRWFQLRMDEIETTGRFSPFTPPLMTAHKQGIVDDSRSGFYLRVRTLLESRRLTTTHRGGGLVSLSEIDAQIEADRGYREVSNGQKRADMEALGFRQVRTKTGRFWELPKGFPVAVAEF